MGQAAWVCLRSAVYCGTPVAQAQVGRANTRVLRYGRARGGMREAEGARVQRQVRWVLLPVFVSPSVVHACIVFGISVRRGRLCGRGGGGALAFGMRGWGAESEGGHAGGTLESGAKRCRRARQGVAWRRRTLGE